MKMLALLASVLPLKSKEMCGIGYMHNPRVSDLLSVKADNSASQPHIEFPYCSTKHHCVQPANVVHHVHQS